MPQTIQKYFTCANSCQGFINFFSSTLGRMEKIYILKGGPGTGKSTLMKKIGAYFSGLGEDVEYIYCSSDASSLDGVILSSRKAAVVDGTAPHVIEAQAPGAIEEYISLGSAWDAQALSPKKKEILSIKQEIASCYSQVYHLLEQAKKIHDDWEKIYIANTDYERLSDISRAFCCGLLKGCPSKPVRGSEVHRFFGASTPEGSINYIDNLTEGLNKRYFIKGRPGTGKSTLMKQLAAQAMDAGLDAEIYHCSFDPDSLDMVVLRDIGLAVFDATAPHELFPSRGSDEILDLYSGAVKPGTDEENAPQLAAIEDSYNAHIRESRKLLGTIHTLHDDLERIYINAMDFSIIDKITEDLTAQIEQLKIQR